MTKSIYLNTGLASLVAFLLLIIMDFSWPQTEYSINDVILDNVTLSEIEKQNYIKTIGINYALDTIFIFSWIGSWIGLFLHFKALNIKLIGTCLGLSILGALLDITENSMSFMLLINNYKNADSLLFTHSIIRDISFWLPMLGSFMLTLVMPKQKGFENIFLKSSGLIGVLFAILGMYIQYFSIIPYYWFGIWFLSATIFLLKKYKIN
ncbi:hypothetical protein M601_003580 [Cellulophaga baltica 4]|nr:hypothetical protein M601_003580 [Cellulophaga baltica 4]